VLPSQGGEELQHRAGKQGDERQQALDGLKLLLTLPLPAPPGAEDDADGLNLLRYLWFAYEGSSKELAAQLEISPAHLMRLLRGDRHPRRALRERIEEAARSAPATGRAAG
jgi:hypothetical protein